MKRLLPWLLVLLAAPVAARFQPSMMYIGDKVATLPAVCRPGQLYGVTDALTAADCTLGGGTTAATCRCDNGGTSYTTVGQTVSGTPDVFSVFSNSGVGLARDSMLSQYNDKQVTIESGEDIYLTTLKFESGDTTRESTSYITLGGDYDAQHHFELRAGSGSGSVLGGNATFEAGWGTGTGNGGAAIIKGGYSAGGTGGALQLWGGSGSVADGQIFLDGESIRFNSLRNCDTIDTDGTGVLSCGTDDGSLWTDGGTTTYLTATTDLLCVGCTSTTSALEINDSGGTTVVIHDTAAAGGAGIELGTGGSGDRNALIDLTGDDTYTDYGFRLYRLPGANGGTQVTSRGTGSFSLTTVEAAPMLFYTENDLKFTLAAGTASSSLTAASKSAYFGTTTSHYLHLVTSNSWRINIDGSGYVGVGELPTSGAMLSVNGETNADYFEPQDGLCYVYEAGGGQTIGTSWATIGIDTSVLCHSNFSFASDTVTVTGAGYYMVDATACADSSSSSSRNSVLWRLTNSAGTEYAGTRRGSYHRIAANGEDCSSWNVILNLGASGTVRIEGQSTATSTITTMADGVTLRLERVSG